MFSASNCKFPNVNLFSEIHWSYSEGHIDGKVIKLAQYFIILFVF